MWDLSSARGLETATERRRYRRKNLLARQIGIHFSSGNRGIVTDLSEGGIAVSTDAPLDLSFEKFVQVGLSDRGRRIEASCQLAWTKAPGSAGLRFVVLSDGSQDLIREWLAMPSAAPVNPLSMRQETPAALFAMPALSALAAQDGVTLEGAEELAATPISESLPLDVIPQVAALEREISGLTGEDSSYAQALNLIVELARLLTKADGAAIALRAEEEMVCRASVGTAPDLGVRLNLSAGLSGECVRTGLMVRCNDTEMDPRVNATACRQMNVRSLAVVPLFNQGTTVGILEVLSHRSQAFDNSHLVILPRVAELITRLTPKETGVCAKPLIAMESIPVESAARTTASGTHSSPTSIHFAQPLPSAGIDNGSAPQFSSPLVNDRVDKPGISLRDGARRQISEHPFPYGSTPMQPDGGQNRVRINPDDLPRAYSNGKSNSR